MNSDQIDEKPFNCSLCEAKGVIDFDTFRRCHGNVQVKISVQGLPSGITADGVQNLFISIGKPLAVKYFPHKSNAIVEFDSLNKAELAVRDLHNKPPYKLKVFLLTSKFPSSLKFFNSFNKAQSNASDFEAFSAKERFLLKEVSFSVENEIIHGKKKYEMLNELQSLFKGLNYDSSYKMHQKNFDFRIEGSNSVTLGRGYFYLGKDRFLGGLQRFSAESEGNKENYFCENCNSQTTKICSICFNSYCSNTCLNSGLNHRNGPCFNGSKQFSKEFSSDQSLQSEEDQVTIKSSCAVVISTFLTLKQLFVRPIDDLWEEKFCRMCNDVAAAAAIEGKSLKGLPTIGELCIAKFYQDCCYYRAKILSIENEKIMVFFLDFGNVQETNVADLKSLPENLKRVSGFAVKVDLIDVAEGTSAESINYYNALTANRIPLILKFKSSMLDGVTLTEKESGDSVNEKVSSYITPSWKKDPSVLSKLGDVFYLESIPSQLLEIGKTYDLTLAFIDKKEFDEFGCFWMTDSEGNSFRYVKGELKARILEYCEHLKNDYYLPRENELCLGKENGEWQRCVNLRSEKTTCWLFFIDEGKTSFVETKNVRKMISDFLEGPSQAIRCLLPVSGEPKLKTNSEIRLKLYECLKNNVGEVIESVLVKNFGNGAYQVDIPLLSFI